MYPIPGSAGLGVHITLDLAGRARFGPDVEWLRADALRNLRGGVPPRLDFTVDPSRVEGFYDEIRKYWPGLPDDSLEADYAGIRPKLSLLRLLQIFEICGPLQHGTPGLVHLLGIESPGLTRLAWSWDAEQRKLCFRSFCLEINNIYIFLFSCYANDGSF